MTLGVVKVSFAQSVLDRDCPTGGSGRYCLQSTEQKPGLLLTHLTRTRCLSMRTVLEFCMGPVLTFKACLSALRYFKFFWYKKKFLYFEVICCLRSFPGQIPIKDSDTNESQNIKGFPGRYLKLKNSADDARRKKTRRTLQSTSCCAVVLNSHCLYVFTIFWRYWFVSFQKNLRHTTEW